MQGPVCFNTNMLASLTPARAGLFVLLAALLYGCAKVLAPFWTELFLALILTVVFYPLERWLTAKLKRRTLSVWLTTLAVGVLFLLPVSLFGLVLVREGKAAYDAIAGSVGPSGGFEFWGAIADRISALIGLQRQELDEFLWGRLQSFGGSALSNVLKSLQGVGSWVLSSVIALITFFFLLDGGPDILRTLKEWSPLQPEVMDELFAEIEKLIYANIYGVLGVALAQGGLVSVGFWFSGLGSGFFWGAVAGVMSVLPFIGAGFVWIPAVIYLAVQGASTKAILLALWGLLVVSNADNVVRPIVLSGKAQMNTGIMLFALLGGIQAFGLIGLFAGPIVFSLAIAVMRIWKRQTAVVEPAGTMEPTPAVAAQSSETMKSPEAAS
jgi:predicted PurR-regulated permease PerM